MRKLLNRCPIATSARSLALAGALSCSVLPAMAAEPLLLSVFDSANVPVPGGSIKLTPLGADGGSFYLLTDDNSDGKVALTDWDGKPIPVGDYSAEYRGTQGQVLRVEQLVVEAGGAFIRGEGGDRQSAEAPQSDNTLLIAGGVAAAVGVAALAGGGGGGGDGGGGSGGGGTTPADFDLSGTIDCSVSRDSNRHETLVGTVGGSSRVVNSGGALTLEIPISSRTASLTGSLSGNTFNVTGNSTAGGTPDVESTAQGTVIPDNGIINFVLTVGSNGALPDSTGQTGIDYQCDGRLTAGA